MEKHCAKFAYLLLSLLLLPSLGLAQYDLNDNGTNEIIFTTAVDGVLHWYAQDPYTDELISLGTFGHPTYKTSFARWLADEDLPVKAYLRKGKNAVVFLNAEGVEEELPLGLSKDKAYSILGGNINSANTADALLINGQRRKWAWKFAFEPFTEEIQLKRLLFGQKNEYPFLLRLRGNTDSLCVLRVNKRRKDFITCRRLNTRRKKLIRLKGFQAPKQPPDVLKQANGKENLVFIENIPNGLKATTVTNRGKVSSIPTEMFGASAYIVHYSDADGTQGILAINEDQTFILEDGREGQILVKHPEFLSENKLNEFAKDEFSATPAPTATTFPATVIPTIASTNTSILTANMTETIAAIFTSIPTSTPINTATPINTVTAIPTYTPYPTSTATLTFTATSTYTSTPTTTNTNTSTNTATFTATSTTTHTPTITHTVTQTPTATNTNTAIPTQTPYPTYTPYPTLTYTPTVGAFISIWDTRNTSGSETASNQIRLPLESGGTYNFNVDWGDGNNDNILSWNQTERTHTYASDGIYTVTITGTLHGFTFNNSGDRNKILQITNWGQGFRFGNSGGYFYNCDNLIIPATDAPDFTGTTSLYRMFRGADSFNSPVSHWDTSGIINMASLFHELPNFNQDLSTWDTSSVTTMSAMFATTNDFNQDISGWDTSSVSDMSAMFHAATSFNQNLSSWCVPSIGSEPSYFGNPGIDPVWGTCP